MTKDFLRVWSKSNIQEVDRKIKQAREEINRVDSNGETSNLSNEDIIAKSSHYTELLKNMQLKEEMAQQKARKTWLKSGDANTSFFHKCIRGRWRRNEINVISVEGKELREVEDIKQGVMKYFAELFIDEGWQRPTLEGLSFKTISEEDRRMLIQPFTEEEVKAAVWNCESTKAPGPDGFTFGFIKIEWEVIKADIRDFLMDFHTNGRIVRGSNASFLVLIPKRENPQGIEEYRPISLIGCMYKILAKVLANRLSRVLNTIIGENQSAFIEGRQLVDSVVVANEAIDDVRKRKSRCFVFKIDFEKAYDKVSWSFLDYMMEKMGFDKVWREWIAECLRSNTVSVLLNGSATKEFSMSRGLRQGDPLSPFLFLMVAEALNGLTSATVAKGYLRGVKIGKGELEISHLQFADDTIFMGEATEDNIWMIKCIMRAFELVSGLKVIHELDKIRRNFLWGGVGGGGDKGLWSRVLLEKYGGKGGNWISWMKEGRGIGSPWWKDICKLNTGLGNKDGWLLPNFNLKLGDGTSVKFWLDVWVGEDSLANVFPRLFLLDINKNCSIYDRGQWSDGGWCWRLQWRRPIRAWEEENLQQLIGTINHIKPVRNVKDTWRWRPDNEGKYTTRSAYEQLAKKEESTLMEYKKIWSAQVPSKVSACPWQMLLDRIPTKVNLAKRGTMDNNQAQMAQGLKNYEERLEYGMVHNSMVIVVV
ncbi:hypothetical protein SLEP1_g44325 [Rubroshorea leprosula]|uniref:Reverse transcriptase domain-containing protein n=1 Tax=Rubroshorea leprosula TaxID=152421 RepID=A0AAV5LG95_9ROSI|nr:hypothetical protein SLEP1_g44325 [Rubroshorea leprosula]